MTVAHLLPILMIIESAAASGVYFAAGDWRHGGYWACAALITIFVTV